MSIIILSTMPTSFLGNAWFCKPSLAGQGWRVTQHKRNFHLYLSHFAELDLDAAPHDHDNFLEQPSGAAVAAASPKCPFPFFEQTSRIELTSSPTLWCVDKIRHTLRWS